MIGKVKHLSSSIFIPLALLAACSQQPPQTAAPTHLSTTAASALHQPIQEYVNDAWDYFVPENKENAAPNNHWSITISPHMWYIITGTTIITVSTLLLYRSSQPSLPTMVNKSTYPFNLEKITPLDTSKSNTNTPFPLPENDKSRVNQQVKVIEVKQEKNLTTPETTSPNNCKAGPWETYQQSIYNGIVKASDKKELQQKQKQSNQASPLEIMYGPMKPSTTTSSHQQTKQPTDHYGGWKVVFGDVVNAANIQQWHQELNEEDDSNLLSGNADIIWGLAWFMQQQNNT